MENGNVDKKKIWWIVGIFVFVGALTAGGYFAWQKISWQPPFPKTRGGISLEKILPENTTFVLSFNPSDSDERGRSQKLWNTVLQDKKDALPLLMAQNLASSEFPEASQEDFLQLLDSSYAFTFAMEGEISRRKSPTFYFLLAVDDTNKDALLEIVKRLQANKPALRADFIGDVIRVTNAKENPLVFKKSLADSTIFKKSFRELKAPFSGYMFVSPKFFGQLFAAASSGSFHAKESGFLVSAMTIGDGKNSVLLESPYNFTLQSYSALLYQFVPGASDARKPIFYVEGQGFGEILFKSFKDFLENFKKSTGFDFETEVKPVLNNGFAMAMHDTDSLLPAFSFFINAETTSEKALNIVKSLQERDTAWIILGNLGLQSGTSSPVIEERQRFKNMPDAGTIKIHLDRIPKEVAAIPLFEKLTEPLEISYGMTNTNLLFFSTLPNFEEAFENGKSIGESTNILQQSRELLDMEPGSIAYFDFDALGDYIERAFSFAKQEEKFSGEQEEVYGFLKKYLSPIKEFIQVSQGDGKTLRGKSFLKIAP